MPILLFYANKIFSTLCFIERENKVAKFSGIVQYNFKQSVKMLPRPRNRWLLTMFDITFLYTIKMYFVIKKYKRHAVKA